VELGSADVPEIPYLTMDPVVLGQFLVVQLVLDSKYGVLVVEVGPLDAVVDQYLDLQVHMLLL
jgi:hypothetical protein